MLACLLKWMSSSYSSLDWVLSPWAHSLCVDSLLSVFILFFFILRICHVIVTQWGGPDTIEA